MPTRKIQIDGRALTLDARPDRLDLRDRPYLPLLKSLPRQWPSDADARQWLPAYIESGRVRNQGAEGACTGFGLAAVIDYLHVVNALMAGQPIGVARRSSPAMLYRLARMYDEWPGEDYEGSSCRGALKGWHRHGVCREELWKTMLDADGNRQPGKPSEDLAHADDPDRNWDVDALGSTLGVYYRIDPRSVVDMQAAIVETGAIYCSGGAHEGWAVKSRKKLNGHDDLVRIKHIASPKDQGGHAFALVGYNELGFVLQNSWGTDWGTQGFALLPYEDWVAHGEDAWVFTLGVPRMQAALAQRTPGQRTLRAPRFLVPAGGTGGVDRPAGLIGGTDSLERRFRNVPAQVRPLDADTAYRHTLVLDRGFPVCNDITAANERDALQAAAFDRPLEWMRANGTAKLLIYAHGGLNSEEASISRIRALAPYALANGIYPLFITWRSGPLETVSDLVEELFAKLGFGAHAPARGWADKLTEKTDRLLEPLLRAPGGAMWEQMKLNATRASGDERGGCFQLVQQVQRLAAQTPKLEVHLIGHSAGALVLGAMMPLLAQAGLKAASLRLFAPACTAGFALEHYGDAVASGTLDPKTWHLHLLSDANERDDAVGPYRKSLLYLVSRSFEVHKTPILGLEKVFDREAAQPGKDDDLWSHGVLDEVRAWQDFWAGLGDDHDRTNRLDHTLRAGSVATGGGTIPASHGCFDNSVAIIGKALSYVAGKEVEVHRLDY